MLPVGKGISRITFGLPRHSFRASLVVTFCFVHHIIVAHYIQNRCMRVENLPIMIPGAESLCYWTGIIERCDDLLEFLGGLNHLDFLAFYYLVTNAVGNDAWMVTVAEYHGFEIFLVAGVYGKMIVILGLLSIPAVKSFIYDHHTQAVASIEHGSCLWVVGSTDQIESCFFHQSYLADFCSVECHGANHSIVMVDTSSIDKGRLAI